MAQLRLIALDAPDVTIISAHLQDAVAKVGDMAYSPRDKRFVIHCNRFSWQADDSGKRAGASKTGERRRAALRIERATSVKSQAVDRAGRGTVLSILAVLFEPDPNPDLAPAGVVTIVCAGGASLRLGVECVEMVLEDLGPAWEASAVPTHEAK